MASTRDKKSPLTNLIAGGTAGFMEALICHPLDTIKVRMQLAKNVPRNAAVSLCSRGGGQFPKDVLWNEIHGRHSGMRIAKRTKESTPNSQSHGDTSSDILSPTAELFDRFKLQHPHSQGTHAGNNAKGKVSRLTIYIYQ
jgi:hypothetical protein